MAHQHNPLSHGRARAAPVITNPSDGSVCIVGTLTITGTAEPGSTIELVDWRTPVGTIRADERGSWSMTLQWVEAGTHMFRATAVDSDGNTQSGSQLIRVTATAGPVDQSLAQHHRRANAPEGPPVAAAPTDFAAPRPPDADAVRDGVAKSGRAPMKGAPTGGRFRGPDEVRGPAESWRPAPMVREPIHHQPEAGQTPGGPAHDASAPTGVAPTGITRTSEEPRLVARAVEDIGWTPQGGTEPPREKSYQRLLRAVGAYLDKQPTCRISMVELPDGFVVRVHRSMHEVETHDIRFDQQTLTQQLEQMEDGRTREDLLPHVKVRHQGIWKKLPTGHQDVLRALGYELDQENARQVTIDELEDGMILTFRSPDTPDGASRKYIAVLDLNGLERVVNRAFKRRGGRTRP